MVSVLSRRSFIATSGAALLANTAEAQDHLMLPDGETTRAKGITATLINPTKRYQHAVLGDDIEAAGFQAVIDGKSYRFQLGEDAVFEDRRVRLWDIDGDGKPEAVIVKSYVNRGAAIASYKLGPQGITPFAESAAIGTRNRWLNPIGSGDFTGSGQVLIAAVITPHLTGSVRLYKLSGDTFSEVARLNGFTNHIIGSRDLDLAKVVEANDGVRIVIPSLDRWSLALLSFKDGSPRVISQKSVPSRILKLGSVSREQAQVTLENGQGMKISFK
jgi:hypothetical protein